MFKGLFVPVSLCVCLSGAAIADGRAEPTDYWTGDPHAPLPETLPGGTVAGVATVAALVQKGNAVVVDVAGGVRRPTDLAPGAPWLPVAHRGLPGAEWIPGAGEGVVAADVEEFFRRRLAAATRGDFDVPVIVYCHSACWLSWNAAKRAIALGYTRVVWFKDGVEGWTGAGHPTAVLEPGGPGAGATHGPVSDAIPSLMVLDLELSGDLGGPDFAAEHAQRLETETARLRQDLEHTGLYRLLDNAPARSAINRLKSQQAYLHDCNGCDLDLGRRLGADLVFVAWVNRVSGRILTLPYEVHDVATGQIAARKSYDFRGDSDNTWNHAIDYMVRDIKASAAARSSDP